MLPGTPLRADATSSNPCTTCQFAPQQLKIGTKEKKLCNMIETVKRDVSRPIVNKVPAESICKRLGKRDGEVCKIRDKASSQANLKKVDEAKIKKMRVKELKAILFDYGAACDNCLEKSDFVNRVLQLQKGDEL